jgi:hypothetical protein
VDQYIPLALIYPVLLADLYHPKCLVGQYHLVFPSALIHLADLYHPKCLEDQYILLVLIHLLDLVRPPVPDHPLGLAGRPHLLRLEDLVYLEDLEVLEVLVILLDPVLLGDPLGIGDLPHIHYDYKFPLVIVRVHSSPFYLLTGYQYLTFGSFHVGYELSAFVP